MRTKITSSIAVLAGFALPLIASAQSGGGGGSSSYSTSQGLVGLIKFANNTLNDVIILMITLAILAFFYGIVRFILNPGGDKARQNAINTMLYSLIGIFVMVSVWGLIHLLQSTFGVSNTDAAEAPSALQIN